jgi:hypothetical protein
MITRADWPEATAALTASSALSALLAATDGAIARTLIASTTASVRQAFSKNCMQFFQKANCVTRRR